MNPSEIPLPLNPLTRPAAYLDAVAAMVRKIKPEHLPVELEGIARVLVTLAREAQDCLDDDPHSP